MKKPILVAGLLLPLSLSVVSCSSSTVLDNYELESNDPSLPGYSRIWDEEKQTQPTGFECKTNLVRLSEVRLSGDRIEYDAAVKTVYFEEDEKPEEPQRLRIYIAPDVPSGQERRFPDADVQIFLKNGDTYRYISREFGENKVYLTPAGKDGEVQDLMDRLDSGASVGRGALTIPVPVGIVTEDNPIKELTVSVAGQDIAGCKPENKEAGIARPYVEITRPYAVKPT